MTLAKRPGSPGGRGGAGNDPPNGRRGPYRSALRQERATDTRRRITVAALALFNEHGFSATTMATIADAAGVAVQTVYATFGSKGAILKALLAQLEDDAGAQIWRERIAAASDPRHQLEAFAEWSAAMFSTSKTAIVAAQGAGGDPAIAEVKAEADRHRREALDDLVANLSRRGALRPRLAGKHAVDRAWMLTGVELYLAATDGCGWSDTEYAAWLGGMLVSQLLTEGNEPLGRPRPAS